jgi:uncharacterized membrane protein
MYLQVFVIGAVCIWCTSYGLSLIARFVIALVVWLRGNPTPLSEFSVREPSEVVS